MAFGGVFHPVFRPVFDAGGMLAATPYSLYYDSAGDYVDCGTPASLLGLNANAFTVDVYWQCPATVANWSYLTLVSQGNLSGPYQGWTIRASFNGSGTAFHFAATLGGIAEISVPATPTIPTGLAWYYIRLRKTGIGDTSGNTYTYLSYNAGASGTSRSWAPDVTSAYNCYHGMNGMGNFLLKGNLCYVHIWAANKGTLASVPTASFAIDADTRGRWLYSDGGGTTLTDSSANLNHGTIHGDAVWSTTVPPGWTL